VDRRAWCAASEADPLATFFATPDWSDILVASFAAFRSRPFLFSFGSGARVVVPAIEVRRAGSRVSALHSMPFGTYGGLVGGSTLAPLEREAILGALVRETWPRYQTTVFSNPLGGADSLGERALARDHVYAPDLAGGYDAWWGALDARTRYHIRKAERHGVEVRTVMDAEDFDAFHRLYDFSARAWEPVARFGLRFFRAVWHADPARVRLFTAHLQGEIVAGILVFQHNAQVTPFLSATLPGARALAPTNLLYARLIESCCREGRTSFSFLGSGGKPGVERFKRSMGGIRREFRYVDHRSPLFGLVHNPALDAARRAGRRVRRVVARKEHDLLDAEGWT